MCRSSRRAAALLGVLITLLATFGITGCRSLDSDGGGRPAPAVRPAAPDLGTPESAVRAYTDWTSYAYRTLDSSVATPVTTPAEEVRVDSYVEYNRQAGRAIEQRLTDYDYRKTSESSSAATLAGSERWAYRYLAPDGARYLGKPSSASYEVTYTLIAEPGGRWAVDRVQVEASSAP